MTQMLDSCPVRMFRLTNEPGGLGLSCTPTGVALAGVPLLRKTHAGFVPRPAFEITSLFKAAYGENPTALQARLDAIAQALNRGDFATAMIAAVHTETPELSAETATRLRQIDDELTKYNYNPNEPRDWHGRWTSDGSASSASIATSGIETDQRAAPRLEHDSWRVAENTFASDASAVPDAEHGAATAATANSDASRKPTTLQETFEQKYDDLGPEDFADQVIRFGYWLEAHGRELSPAERERALAEYSFLQNRLLLWLNYEYKSVREYGYLLSATTKLYQGANNSGLVPFGHLPASMLHVAGTVALFDTPPPRRLRPTTKTPAEELPAELKPPKGVELGAVVDRETAGIVWGKGIKEQGIGKGDTGWEKYNANQNPDAKLLPQGSTGFDLFAETTGEAISAKTLDTKTMTYIRKPQEIYRQVTGNVDDAVNYRPRKNFDVDPALISSKTIQLAIPEHTSPEQWRYLLRAIVYGKDNGVKVVITGIR